MKHRRAVFSTLSIISLIGCFLTSNGQAFCLDAEAHCVQGGGYPFPMPGGCVVTFKCAVFREDGEPPVWDGIQHNNGTYLGGCDSYGCNLPYAAGLCIDFCKDPVSPPHNREPH